MQETTILLQLCYTRREGSEATLEDMVGSRTVSVPYAPMHDSSWRRGNATGTSPTLVIHSCIVDRLKSDLGDY